MKKVIRRGIFESNSSSSHSLIITKNTEIEDFSNFRLREDGTLEIWWDRDLEFDRSPEAPLIDFYGRLKYLIASYSNDEEKINEIAETVKELIPGCTGIKFPKQYRWRDDKEYIYYGYVDHQSSGILHRYLSKYNVSFKEFLTNKKYIIILDGDEYCMWDAMKESGLINKDYIKQEVGIDGEENY